MDSKYLNILDIPLWISKMFKYLEYYIDKKRLWKKFPFFFPLLDSKKINLFYIKYIEYIWNMHRITENMF